MANDLLEVELRITDTDAEVVISKSKQLLKDFVREAEKAQPQIKFSIPNQNYIDLDKLEKRAALTRKSFEDITKTRLDSGNIGFLTKEIVKTSERARQLQSDIGNIKKEISNPARKSSIAFLTEELKAAEREADSLTRKLDRVNAKDAGNASGRGGARGRGGRRGGVSDGLLTGLELVDDFAPEGLNRPFNAAVKGLVSVGSLSGTALLGLGAVAAAGVGLVKISQNIREEAERRLKVEESIASAINRQILGQKEALANVKEQREEAQRGREFARELQTRTRDELKQRRDLLVQLQSLTPETINGQPNAVFQAQTNGILALEARVDAINQENKSLADTSFNQRFESFQKNQEKDRQQLIEAEKKSEADKKKREQDIEKAKEKVKDFEKQYLSTFSNLFQKTGASNPIFTVFNEGDQALKSLKENLKGLPTEIQAVALEMQKKLNFSAQFQAALDNKLSVFDLRSEASNFRNPFNPDDQKKEQDQFLARFFASNPNYAFLNNIKPVADVKDLDQTVRQDILKRFGSASLSETTADRFNKNFDDKFNQIYDPRQTAEQRAIADKKFISLTSGVNPLDLSRENRERAASAREREAIIQDKYFSESVDLQKRQLAQQERIAENTKRGMQAAEKGGTKVVELTVKSEDNVRAELKPAANSSDTARAYYDPNLDFGGGGGFTNR